MPDLDVAKPSDNYSNSRNGHAGYVMAVLCRLCSLVPGLGLWLSNHHPCRAHCSLRGRGSPPQDGVCDAGRSTLKSRPCGRAETSAISLSLASHSSAKGKRLS